jgi:type II secretory pathway pseudopilin PulG
MCPNTHSESVPQKEEGYILFGVIILLAIFLILMAVAAPKVRESIRRDQEVETMHRGKQYMRAVQLYYRKFHNYPQSVDDLEGTNGLRFLRQKYTDALTGQDDWQPVFMGQNKAPLSMGYFGQVLNAGAAVPSVNGGTQPSNILGTPPPSAYDSFSNNSGSSPANSGGQNQGSSGITGQVFGAGIIGFSPASNKASILVYKTKTHYNEWEFVYDPMTDPMARNWWIPPASPPTNSGAPGASGNPTVP